MATSTLTAGVVDATSLQETTNCSITNPKDVFFRLRLARGLQEINS
jgi:hypothetical protein